MRPKSVAASPSKHEDMDIHRRKKPHRWQRLKEAVHDLGMAPGRSAAIKSGSREGLSGVKSLRTKGMKDISTAPACAGGIIDTCSGCKVTTPWVNYLRLQQGQSLQPLECRHLTNDLDKQYSIQSNTQNLQFKTQMMHYEVQNETQRQKAKRKHQHLNISLQPFNMRFELSSMHAMSWRFIVGFPKIGDPSIVPQIVGSLL